MQDAHLLGSADTGRTAEVMDEAKDTPSASVDMKDELKCSRAASATKSEGVISGGLLGVTRRR